MRKSDYALVIHCTIKTRGNVVMRTQHKSQNLRKQDKGTSKYHNLHHSKADDTNFTLPLVVNGFPFFFFIIAPHITTPLKFLS